MKTSLVFAIVFAATVLGSSQTRSQAPGARVTTAEALTAIKAQNQKFLDQQAATLQRLEVLKKEAGQMRIFARRN